MTVLARRRSHICCNCLSICSRGCPLSASDSRNSLPARTSSTPEKPSELSECWIALPCGSRTDGLSSTVTVAFMDGDCKGDRRKPVPHLSYCVTLSEVVSTTKLVCSVESSTPRK